MATVWLKLTGSAAQKFNDQYQTMLEANELTREDFSEVLFLEFLLDIRAKAQGLNVEDDNVEPDHS